NYIERVVNLVERRAILIRAGDIDHNPLLLQSQFCQRRAEHRLACSGRSNKQQFTERCKVKLLVNGNSIAKERFHIGAKVIFQILRQDDIFPVYRWLEEGVRSADDKHILTAFKVADSIITLDFKGCPSFQLILRDNRDGNYAGVLIPIVRTDVQYTKGTII